MLWILFAGKGNNFTVMVIEDKKKIPLWTGEMELRENTAGFRPHKIRVLSRDGKPVKDESYVQSKVLIDLMRKANRIMIANGFSAKRDKELLSMLAGYQLKPVFADVCRFCLLEGRFDFVTKSSVICNNERICMDCAKKELLKALRNSRQNFGDSTVEFFEQVLERTKDLDRTIAMLNPEKLDPEVTRYDTVRSFREERKMPVRTLPIHNRLKDLLLKKAKFLLPVQALSVDAGLFEHRNLMVVSATATGKTLVGEMGGIENILSGRGKMLYLVPLVALANQKYEQFKERYSAIGLQTSIRIGAELIKTKTTQHMKKTLDSDIIVGTYEGIDHILRLGDADALGQIGTVVIDEVHMITDPERGPRLDGLIARLRYTAPEAQFIYLSATVASPEMFAQNLDAQLVVYENRPVPIDRHMLFVPEHDKLRIMTRLINDEWSKTSSKGHRGQTIIFTNSRANCHALAAALPIKAAAYHGGLYQHERKRIETAFEKGELPVVVTTAALAAGVDFPASQVIFESMAMGIDWLSVQDFLQMSGRAGRPDFHDRGVVVLLPVPGKTYSSVQKETEEEVAVSLLKGTLLKESFVYGDEEQYEEILASVGVTSSKKDLSAINQKMFADLDENVVLLRLQKYGFVRISGQTVAHTELGRIASAHFLSVTKTFMIRDSIVAKVPPIRIITNLEFFSAATFKIADQLSRELKMNLPARVFQGACIDIIYDGEHMKMINPKYRQLLLNFAADMLTCGCRDSPHCGCVERKFSEKVILLRTKGMDPTEIIAHLEETYGITAYKGDVFSYLEDAVRNLEAVELIAGTMKKPEVAKEARELRKKIAG